MNLENKIFILKISGRILQYLERRGISQSEYANDLNITLQQVNKWFTDKEFSIPPIYIIKTFAIYDELSAEFGIRGDGDMIKDEYLTYEEMLVRINEMEKERAAFFKTLDKIKKTRV